MKSEIGDPKSEIHKVQPIAVIGTFRSGSSIVAAMLDRLGVDMGAPFFRDFFEPADLAVSLRRWWQEPKLVPSESASNRAYLLRQWLESRGDGLWIGAKHPLLTLSVKDLQRAWGSNTKFIWCRRPLADAVASLEKLNWWPNSTEVQQRLLEVAESHFPVDNGLVVDFQDAVDKPDSVVERIIEFLQLDPTTKQINNARQVVRKRVDGCRPRTTHGTSTTVERDDVRVRGEYHEFKSPRPGKIVATMLCHNCEDTVADAVKSIIDFVDTLLIVNTGCKDRSLKIAGELAGSKLEIRRFDWQDDFATARNFAIACATELGAQWALTIDTDERLDFGSLESIEMLRAKLDSEPVAQAWFVDSQSGCYQKERFIRLPTQLIWQGRVHESLCGASADGRPKLGGVHFRELPKSHHEFQSKLERDLRILREELLIQPENGRTWFYLGQTLYGLKQTEGAILAFDRCTSLRTWDELSAWACYRSAKCLADCLRYEEAIERCAIGLAIDPQFPELTWMSAWCCLRLNQFQRAIAWATMAVSIGGFSNPEALASRVGFRDLLAWYDGPYEILCAAYAKLGYPSKLEIAKRQLEKAQAHHRRIVHAR